MLSEYILFPQTGVENISYFKGGLEELTTYINSNLRYPILAFRNNIEADVYCHFDINPSGEINNIYIWSKGYPQLDYETARLIKILPKEKLIVDTVGTHTYSLLFKYQIQKNSNNEVGIVKVETPIVLERDDFFEIIFKRIHNYYPGYNIVPEDNFYKYLSSPAEFYGGYFVLQKWLNENIHYPDKAWDDDIQERIVVSFEIDEKGNVKNAKIENGHNDILCKEALRVVRSMPKWKPAELFNEKIPYNFNLPINFVINYEEDNEDTGYE